MEKALKLITRTYMESLAERYKDDFVKEVKSHVCRNLENDELYVDTPAKSGFDREGCPCLIRTSDELNAENMDLFIDKIRNKPDYYVLNIIGREKEFYDQGFQGFRLSMLHLVKRDGFLAGFYEEPCRLGIQNRFLEEVDKYCCRDMDIGYCMPDFFEKENLLSIISRNPRYEKAVQEYLSKNNG